MSYLAGMLLIYMEPYQAFVSFANLLNNHYFKSLFSMNVNEVTRLTYNYLRDLIVGAVDPETLEDLRPLVR